MVNTTPLKSILKKTSKPDNDYQHLPRLNEVSNKFISEFVLEKERLTDEFPLTAALIDHAIDKVLTTGRIPGRETHADVSQEKPIKVSQKVFVPTQKFPKFNFVGKILGPKGNSLRRLEEETLCKIKIKGRNSMRNPSKEEELRSSGDPRLAHLDKDLYVEISTVAFPTEAYARMAYALTEIRKYLIPDKNDEVSLSQMKEAGTQNPTKAFRQFGVQQKPITSILDKLTDKTIEKSHSEEHKDEYKDESSSFQSYSSIQEILQRTSLKRTPSSQLRDKYPGQEKRTRDASIVGQSKTSIYPFVKRLMN